MYMYVQTCASMFAWFLAEHLLCPEDIQLCIDAAARSLLYWLSACFCGLHANHRNLDCETSSVCGFLHVL